MNKKDKIKSRYIKLRLVNALIASLIYFAGAFTDGRVTKLEIIMTIGAAFVVFAAGIREIVDDEIDYIKMRQYCIFSFF